VRDAIASGGLRVDTGRVLADGKVLATDLVELNPKFDIDEVTAFLSTLGAESVSPVES